MTANITVLSFCLNFRENDDRLKQNHERHSFHGNFQISTMLLSAATIFETGFGILIFNHYERVLSLQQDSHVRV